MTISETTRREMHSRLVEVLGTEVADSLMEYLPPVGWADVATRRDLDQLDAAIKGEIAAVRHDLEIFTVEVRADVALELAHQTRTMLFGMFSTMFGTIGVVGALTALSH
ncbi:MAG TPA: hypothetical protein VHV76_07445 [Mycobacteriales bacterium]|nr:hypothetical protein [Mycobacteriales bacterium]